MGRGGSCVGVGWGNGNEVSVEEKVMLGEGEYGAVVGYRIQCVCEGGGEVSVG